VLHDRIIPLANLRMRAAVVRNVEEMVYSVLKKDGVLKGGGMPYEIYVPRVEGKRLFNPIFKRRGSDGAYDLIVFAQEPSLKFDVPNKQVVVNMFMAEVTDGKGTRIETRREKVFEIALPNVANVNRGIRDMTIRDVETRRAGLLHEQEKACGLWAFNALTPMTNGQLDQVPWGGMVGVAARAKDSQREIARLSCEPH